MSLSQEELQKIVAIGLLTDGDIYHRKWDNKYMIRFHSTDPNLHAYFQNIVRLAFREGYSGYSKRNNENLWTTYFQRGSRNQMLIKLLGFSKTYRTNEGSQPSLKFLSDEREEVKIQALRFAMSCDGSVSIKKGSDGQPDASLRLACAHPGLVLQFQQLFRDIGISMNIDRDKNNWSGIHGLGTSKKADFQRFAEIGGFLPQNVKVTNGNFIGSGKNEVLEKILDLRNIPIQVSKDFLTLQQTQS